MPRRERAFPGTDDPPRRDTSVRRETLVLDSVDAPDGVTFELEGTVLGSCVDFTLQQRDEDGRVDLTFSGQAPTGDIIRGAFLGEGHEGCLSEGEFTVRIRKSSD